MAAVVVLVTGLGGGMAMDGRFRPIVEFMYADFMWVAADQLFNQIGKARHMFGGTNPMPLVLRSKVAMGSGYGSQHLMDPAGIMVTNPGWRVVAASTPFDYIGLMNTALALNDPVFVIEHIDLYAQSGAIPADDLDYQPGWYEAACAKLGDGIGVVFRDITDRRNAEAQRDLLVKELEHRIKNTLATVLSIADQTCRPARAW